VIDDILNVLEEDFCDLAVGAQDFDSGLAEGLSAAQIVYLTANPDAVPGNHLDIIAVEHPLQSLHDREKIVHGSMTSLPE